ncbi:MAG: HNH endonuclease signature motif containing protein [Candidatus Pacearchaeota archaeon]
MREFYDSYQVLDGEELVIQFLGEDKFRIIPEKIFKKKVKDKLQEFQDLQDENGEEKGESILSEISKMTNLQKIEILKNEFVFLSQKPMEARQRVDRNSTSVRESVPLALRRILEELYEGKCQVTRFTFQTKSNKPYFELHHIDPEKGNHVKNLLVVSPNTHAQFTHAHVEQHFDVEGWLREVTFNGNRFSVFQIIDSLPKQFEKEIHV